MILVPTPGRYIKLCRTAALLSAADVAERLHTVPRTPLLLRAEQIELIEADVQPMDLDTVVALRAVIHFDVEVLFRLAQIARGEDLPAPQLCETCGWGTVYDQLYWPILGLCRGCYDALAPEDIDARVADRRHPALRSAAA